MLDKYESKKGKKKEKERERKTTACGTTGEKDKHVRRFGVLFEIIWSYPSSFVLFRRGSALSPTAPTTTTTTARDDVGNDMDFLGCQILVLHGPLCSN